MRTTAVVFEEPGTLDVRDVALVAPTAADVVVDVAHSGISTGTERLLWTGRMPAFPGLGYPLVPGYEAVGTVVDAGVDSGHAIGDTVFVPGSRGYTDVRGLFGASARRLVVAGARAHSVDESLGNRAVLLALAATAYHALHDGDRLPELIVGHGSLGRLLARLTIAMGGAPPTVWEKHPVRQAGARGYAVCDAADDPRHDYSCIFDVSGDASLIDPLVKRLAPAGELVLAAFYHEPIAFQFAPAFMRGVRLRIAAEWRPNDLAAVRALVARGQLSLDDLVTHAAPAADAATAFGTAFEDPACVKMVLDWSRSA